MLSDLTSVLGQEALSAIWMTAHPDTTCHVGVPAVNSLPILTVIGHRTTAPAALYSHEPAPPDIRRVARSVLVRSGDGPVEGPMRTAMGMLTTGLPLSRLCHQDQN
jgi:hypothetical protein